MQDYKNSGKCLLDEDMNEVNFKEMLEELLKEIRSGKEKTTSLAEARKIYGNRKQQ